MTKKTVKKDKKHHGDHGGPRRGLWKGSISFGLINIPVYLQSAEENKALHFSMLDSNDLSPIKYKKVNAETGREVPYERIVKGYEYESGQYVIFTKKDFDAANVKATQTIDIEDFILIDEVDPMLFEKPYYLVPQKGGEKGYALIRDALEKTGKAGVGKIVIRTKQHLAAVIPRGDYLLLEVMRFAHEVKEPHEMERLESPRAKANYSPRELGMAEDLIAGMTAKWEPEKYKDTYYDDVMKRVKRKIRAGGTREIAEVEDHEPVEATKVVDLMPLLRRSLEQKKGERARGRHRKHS